MDFALMRQLLALALPMVVSNITVPLLGLVDTAVIGHLPQPHFLSAVALGSMLLSLCYWLCGFLRMSTTALVAQAYGDKNQARQLHAFGAGLLIALCLAFLLVLFRQPLLTLCLSLSGASEQVQLQTANYFLVRIWSAPAALSNMVILGALLGAQNARLPMLLLIIVNLFNIAFDVLLVVYFDWQVMGAAWASVLADYLGMVLGLGMLYRLLCSRWGAPRLHGLILRLKPWRGLRELLMLNRDIFLRSLALQLCLAFMTVQASHLGDDYVALNAILLNFMLFIAFALDGLAYALEALAGKAKGEKNALAFRAIVKHAMLMAFVMAAGFSFFFGLWGEHIVALLTDIVSLREMAQAYLPWIVLLPLLSVWCFIFDGVFIAAADGRAMRNNMLIAAFVVFFPLWWLAQGLGNHALWLAYSAFMAARGLSLALAYKKAMLSKAWFA